MELTRVDALDACRDRPLRYLHEGRSGVLPHPKDLSPNEILLALHAGTLREIPLDLAVWKTDRLFAAWAARHDLPDFRSVQRLFYLLERYHDAIEYDLQAHLGVRLLELFSNRDWRRLLNLIDHLPQNSWYSEAVANDEEHAEMVAKAMAERSASDEKYRPPMRTWSPETSLLTDILDAIHGLSYITRASSGDKTAKPPSPAPRPESAIEKARVGATQQQKKASHEKLVARMLPHRAAEQD